MIVVSEIGEQWSPHTAPARHAEIPTKNNELVSGNTTLTIGIRIPNVPHEVPVAKEITQATTKVIAGSSFASEPAPARASETNSLEPSRPVVD